MADRTGYLIIDERACGGFRNPEAKREFDVFNCCHCGRAYLKNPLRENPRHYCHKCSHQYVCDECYKVMQLPGYIHWSKAELKDLVMTGKAQIVGGSWIEPQLLWLR